jgi:phospholipid/cholesterol/gamma-HCH transport system permease protein
MESSAATRLRDLEAEPEPGAAGRLGRGFADPIRSVLEEIGDMAQFSWRVLIELRGVWRYTAEILRQAGILIVGSAAVILMMQFVMGTICGTNAAYVLRTYGAAAYSGIYTSYCAVRGSLIGFMFGYIVAAKIGTGLAAEIGAMRINSELDAMEAQGINPLRYVVATRLVAGWLTFPFLFAIGSSLNFFAAFLVIVKQVGEVSQGQWQRVHWQFISGRDLIYDLIWVMAEVTLIMLVGMYYGYRAKGGPVGVGAATAKSMMFNIVAIHVLGAFLVVVLWGLYTTVPIGG